MLVTLLISIGSGYIGGLLCSVDLWNPVHALFRDDDNFHHVLQKYPSHYLEVSDEAVSYAKGCMMDIRKIMMRVIPCNLSDDESRV